MVQITLPLEAVLLFAFFLLVILVLDFFERKRINAYFGALEEALLQAEFTIRENDEVIESLRELIVKYNAAAAMAERVTVRPSRTLQ